MIAKVLSASLKGIDAFLVDVEADCTNGLPSFDVVGLPDSAVKESRERVRGALKNSGFALSGKKITINLAPGDVRKEGPGFDLPIACGILASTEQIPASALEGILMVGELSLDGSLNPVKGILSIIDEARRCGINTCFIPEGNKAEGALVAKGNVIAAGSLQQVVRHLKGQARIKPLCFGAKQSHEPADEGSMLDFVDVKGQERVKRAFTIAAAGAHNILMLGPPGAGKTMMARRLPTVMPPLSFEESIEVTKIYSVRGLYREQQGLMTIRPFRSTHHTISHHALVGGGSPPLPGEISLAHHGVLFLDEIAEFPKGTLDALRQPMEDKEIVISRVASTVRYPSNFMLVAASNPCPCGYLGHSDKCRCTENEISKYMGKLSGPLLDRIDLHIEMSSPTYADLNSAQQAESSAQMKQKVLLARDAQQRRYVQDGILFNAHMEVQHIQRYCQIGATEQKMLEQAFHKLGLSARAYHRILKVARTIADLENCESIKSPHILEAVQLRNIDRKLWAL